MTGSQNMQKSEGSESAFLNTYELLHPSVFSYIFLFKICAY